MLQCVQWIVGVVLSGLVSFQASAGEVKIKQDGVTLNAYWSPASERWQSGPVVLMTHGTMLHGKAELMETLQGLFSDVGISSLSITLSLSQDDRHGIYECMTPHHHKHRDAVGEQGAWLSWLEAQGAENVVLLGHSRGGNQTAMFATERDAALIKKVILIAPQTWNEAKVTAGYQKKYGQALPALLDKAQALVDAGKGATEMDVKGFIYCPDAKASAATILSYYKPDQYLDTPSLMPEIKKPVLVIAATDDTVVKGLPERLAPMAEAGTIELVVIDGADHSFRDLYADEVVEYIQAFIDAR